MDARGTTRALPTPSYGARATTGASGRPAVGKRKRTNVDVLARVQVQICSRAWAVPNHDTGDHHPGRRVVNFRHAKTSLTYPTILQMYRKLTVSLFPLPPLSPSLFLSGLSFPLDCDNVKFHNGNSHRDTFRQPQPLTDVKRQRKRDIFLLSL